MEISSRDNCKCWRTRESDLNELAMAFVEFSVNEIDKERVGEEDG